MTTLPPSLSSSREVAPLNPALFTAYRSVVNSRSQVSCLISSLHLFSGLLLFKCPLKSCSKYLRSFVRWSIQPVGWLVGRSFGRSVGVTDSTANRWTIDRGTDGKSFPVELPDKSDLSTAGREYFYSELTSLRHLMGYANYVCFNKGLKNHECSPRPVTSWLNKTDASVSPTEIVSGYYTIDVA